MHSVIAGIGHTRFGAHPGRSVTSLTIEAVSAALADCGVEKDRVDGLFVKYPTSAFEMFHAAKLADAMGLRDVRVCGGWDQGGAANISLISFAAMAIAAGQCEVAVVCFADNPKSGSRWAYARARNASDEKYGWFGTAAHYAMFARRHMELYGTTFEQLGTVAVEIRKYGARNPNAQLRKPITLDDYMDTPLIVDPLRRDDMALISDGGAAVVVCSEAKARELGVAKPVPILGFGQGLTLSARDDLTTTGARIASETAYRMAGLGPADIHLAQIYDCFTPTVIATLEDYGFCRKGEGGRFVEQEGIGLDGRLPLNTSGGLLSETGMPGMQLVIEGVRQMRGEANLQVKGADKVIVSGQGGAMQTQSTLILGR